MQYRYWIVRLNSTDHRSSPGSNTMAFLLSNPAKRTGLDDSRRDRSIHLRPVAVGCKTVLLMRE